MFDANFSTGKWIIPTETYWPKYATFVVYPGKMKPCWRSRFGMKCWGNLCFVLKYLWRTGCILNTRHNRCFEWQISVFTMMCFGLHTICTEFSVIGETFFFRWFFFLLFLILLAISLWKQNGINQLCCYFSHVFYMSFFQSHTFTPRKHFPTLTLLVLLDY